MAQFRVTGRVWLIVDIPVQAESYEGALAKARELRYDDFAERKPWGELLDAGVTIGSISDGEVWE